MRLRQLLLAAGMAAFAIGAHAATNATPFGGDLVDMSFNYNDTPPLGYEGYLIPEDGSSKPYYVMGQNMRIYVSQSHITLDAWVNLNFWRDEGDFFAGLVLQNKTDSLDGFAWRIQSNEGFEGFDLSKLSQQGDTLKINLLDVAAVQGGRLVLAATPVPESSTAAMTVLGVVACVAAAGRARRRRQ